MEVPGERCHLWWSGSNVYVVVRVDGKELGTNDMEPNVNNNVVHNNEKIKIKLSEDNVDSLYQDVGS